MFTTPFSQSIFSKSFKLLYDLAMKEMQRRLLLLLEDSSIHFAKWLKDVCWHEIASKRLIDTVIKNRSFLVKMSKLVKAENVWIYTSGYVWKYRLIFLFFRSVLSFNLVMWNTFFACPKFKRNGTHGLFWSNLVSETANDKYDKNKNT